MYHLVETDMIMSSFLQAACHDALRAHVRAASLPLLRRAAAEGGVHRDDRPSRGPQGLLQHAAQGTVCRQGSHEHGE